MLYNMKLSLADELYSVWFEHKQLLRKLVVRYKLALSLFWSYRDRISRVTFEGVLVWGVG